MRFHIVRSSLVVLALSSASVAFCSGAVGFGVQEPVQEPRPGLPEGDGTVDAAIAATELEAHVKALASDAMRGRAMGSPESLAAARYVADRLAAAGVAPGAEGGSFMQEVPLKRVRYTREPELRLLLADGDAVTLVHGEDFSFPSASIPREPRPLRRVVVRGADDVPAEADASVALVVAGSAREARTWLEDAGHARGVGFGLVIVPRKAKPRARSIPPPALLTDRGAPDGLQLSLRGPWSERIVGERIETIEFVPNAVAEDVRDVNVVGVVAGAGTEDRPELADEIVVLSAHRDHIGIDARIAASDADADAIRNGADDDASGCAAILEIVEALAQGPAPARTTVVLFVTGEERGFVGSRHWVAEPTHPIGRVVCALNFEMLGRPDDLVGGAGHVWLTGDERSTLGDGLRALDVAVIADPRPSFNFFTRSDNVPFAKAGIVAQTLSSYGEHTDYHRVTDEWQTLDYGHMETAVNACLGAVRSLVSGALTPAWNEGEPRF